MKLNILGINFDDLDLSRVIAKINDLLLLSKKSYITTPNPEILLEAQKDEEFFHILNKADLSLPDGVGIKISSWFLGKNLNVVSGADILPELIKISENKGFKISFIIWDKGLTADEDLSFYLKSNYPNLDFQILLSAKNYKEFDVSKIKIFGPNIMVVALGAPFQEKFIYYHQNEITELKLSIGIGGAIDFLTKKIKRAPKWLRKIGLEWLWRLIKQPWRIRRILNAIFVYMFSFLKHKFFNRFFYRKNVVGFIFKEDEVLILNWAKDEEYWGLPQGGVNKKEACGEAIFREVKEETGITDIKIAERFDNIYKYKWPKYYYHSGYKGQKQTLFILKYNGDKNSIKLCPWEHKSFKWVKINDLINESHPVHESAYKIFLEKFKEYETKI